MKIAFLFDENTIVVTSSYVTQDGLPVLEVSHQIDDEDDASVWQFHCGNGDYSPERLQLVALKTIVSLDSSLSEIADLPRGYIAKRKAVGEPWIYEADDCA